MQTERLVDLSCDLGEAVDADHDLIEEQLWPLITSANVACGGHTGDPGSMERAVERAQNHSVLLGAHPSFPDRENFGRRSMSISPALLHDSLLEQLLTLAAIAAGFGVHLTHVKPHGALYNDAYHDAELAGTIVAAVRSFDPAAAIVASPRSLLHEAAQNEGMAVVAEAFADRRYRADGSLVPRSEANALLLAVREAADQALSLASSRLVAADTGVPLEVRFHTLCIHGDMPDAVARLTAIRARLSNAGFGFTHLARQPG
ncbi:MAG TPA: 5-oxoprolinase subunit PxpA [Thermoanaerobaculia bacterium]|nr:5-oxoprolinase subunit PxpA [Thermoanaerobaculia bacterium]